MGKSAIKAGLTAWVALALPGCVADGQVLATRPAPATAPLAQTQQVEEAAPTPTILVSIDGFHPDYLDRNITPTLSRLRDEGAHGPMRPSFPTKTFPNHWTIVTGLTPNEHGITANRMEDARRPGETFTMATVDPWWWGEAKPVWVEAEQAGIRTGNMFWPGSAVAWGGTMQRFGPISDGTMSADWVPFSMQVSNTQRVNTVLDWLRRPQDIRPQFVTLYFDVVDTAGHDGGPDSEELNEAVADVEAHITMLADGLEQLGLEANLVITSDHGMAPTSSERVIALDAFLDPDSYRLIDRGAFATFVPVEGREEELESALLVEHEHMDCWRKSEIPARYQYGSHPRIPPYFCLPTTGWSILPSHSENAWTGGNHGYDPFAPEMTSLFIGHGPAFAKGARVEEFQNTAIAPLLRHLIGLPQDEADIAPLAGSLAGAPIGE